MEVKASLKFVRVGPQKARLMADVIRGKKLEEAMKLLSFMPQKSANLLKGLLTSAMANARSDMDIDNLYVDKVTVDQGSTLKRFRAGSHGRAKPINKRTSHINIVLKEK